MLGGGDGRRDIDISDRARGGARHYFDRGHGGLATKLTAVAAGLACIFDHGHGGLASILCRQSSGISQGVKAGLSIFNVGNFREAGRIA